MSARKEVHYEGVYYDDIDWSKDIHSLGEQCDVCGNTAEIGHAPACYYNWCMMESPRGREFLRNLIKRALIREGRIDAN